MNNTLSGNEGNLLSYWKFDESFGTLTNDYASNNNGTLYNMTNDDWVLSQAPIFSGSGTSDDPYQVATLAILRFISENSSYNDKYYIQTADIDASATSGWNSGAGFSPIGTFTGSYDGQGYTIDGLFINRPYYAGLFSSANGADLDNIGVINADITGSYRVGGLVGYSDHSTITNCYVTGTVSGGDFVGGLVGEAFSSDVENCYAACTVSGSGACIGGLVGWNKRAYCI